jgi:hypothetical protein
MKDSNIVMMTSTTVGQKPEIFSNGFIDILNDGQLNASARFIRLFIGEQGKFAIPLSIYSGVSANNFQSQSIPGQKSNNHLIGAFINPLSGLINVSSEGVVYFKKTKKLTRTGILFHIGTRILTAFKTGTLTDPQAIVPFNFINSFGVTGFYFQTSAWEKSNTKNIGIFWLVLRVHGCHSNPNQINVFLPAVNTDGIYTGYSLGAGVEINKLVDIKTIYYKYLKPPEIDYLQSMYQFSFNYSMR